MSKHTLGPWYISDQYIRHSDHKAICQWGSYTDEADAALIAAAPDLLAALQQVSNALEHYQHWQPTMVGYLADIARAAIAKAEGGS